MSEIAKPGGIHSKAFDVYAFLSRREETLKCLRGRYRRVTVMRVCVPTIKGVLVGCFYWLWMEIAVAINITSYSFVLMFARCQ